VASFLLMIAFKFVFLALAILGNLDSDSLKALRVYFARDFGGYVDNLLAPEKRASSPNSDNI
jgi:hypothetical protein